MISRLAVLVLFSVFFTRPVFAQEIHNEELIIPEIDKKLEYNESRPFETGFLKGLRPPNLQVISRDIRLVEQNPYYMKFSWKATVQVTEEAKVAIKVFLTFFDSDGSSVYETPRRRFVVDGGKPTTLAGNELIDTYMVRKAKKAQIRFDQSP